MLQNSEDTGIVVIGRNEGQRLMRCLRSVVSTDCAVVYVDSGSTDGSLSAARELGVTVLELDMSIPFTAARARNAGHQILFRNAPHIKYVQFVDGDCVLDTGWIDAAHAFLERNPLAACVCGRRKELYPSASFYNSLCDIEWNTPVGEATQCGGDAMFRAGVLTVLGGYRESLVAGEEPELCLRLRERGWKIFRIDQAMTLHDADIQRFGQWWSRSVRAGYAYANIVALHARSPMAIWKRELARTVFWGLVLPCAALVGLVFYWPLGVALLCLYPAQVLKSMIATKVPLHMRLKYALLLTVTKFSELVGVFRFLYRKLMRAKQTLIEYK